MINFLLRIRKNLFELVRIKTLIDAWVISSATGRAIEWTMFSFYAGIITYLITVISTWTWNNLKVTLIVLGSAFAKTILETILKIIRDRKLEKLWV